MFSCSSVLCLIIRLKSSGSAGEENERRTQHTAAAASLASGNSLDESGSHLPYLSVKLQSNVHSLLICAHKPVRTLYSAAVCAPAKKEKKKNTAQLCLTICKLTNICRKELKKKTPSLPKDQKLLINEIRAHKKEAQIPFLSSNYIKKRHVFH